MSILDRLRKTAIEAQHTEDVVTEEEWIRVDGKLVKVVDKHEDAEKGE